MSTLTTALTELALEPFDRRAALMKLEHATRQLNVTPADLLSGAAASPNIAGNWTPCRTCSDPGPDDFPDDKSK